VDESTSISYKTQFDYFVYEIDMDFSVIEEFAVLMQIRGITVGAVYCISSYTSGTSLCILKFFKPGWILHLMLSKNLSQKTILYDSSARKFILSVTLVIGQSTLRCQPMYF